MHSDSSNPAPIALRRTTSTVLGVYGMGRPGATRPPSGPCPGPSGAARNRRSARASAAARARAARRRRRTGPRSAQAAARPTRTGRRRRSLRTPHTASSWRQARCCGPPRSPGDVATNDRGPVLRADAAHGCGVTGGVIHHEDRRPRGARADAREAPRELRRTVARGDDDRERGGRCGRRGVGRQDAGVEQAPREGATRRALADRRGDAPVGDRPRTGLGEAQDAQR